MKAMIRPIRSWLVLVGRLDQAVPAEHREFVSRMREKLGEGWAPTDYEANRMDELDQQYRRTE